MNLPQVENQTIKTNNKVFENKDKKLKTIKEEESHVIFTPSAEVKNQYSEKEQKFI